MASGIEVSAANPHADNPLMQEQTTVMIDYPEQYPMLTSERMK